ncbi:hypothetical protein BBJ28_00011799 [Nothophytophthora sp. Chile5]|nr:hypothetical protein BBJ28_00011799 [Nothophytophthora sp. Chile5]
MGCASSPVRLRTPHSHLEICLASVQPPVAPDRFDEMSSKVQINDGAAASSSRLATHEERHVFLSTRCRYKTGRCPNSRAVKANGTLLLLCEHHRSQQNRTKKRSDIKCRRDRAKKRQVEREKLRRVGSSASKERMGGDASTIGSSSRSLTKVHLKYATSRVPALDNASDFTNTEEFYSTTGSPTAIEDLDTGSELWAPYILTPTATPKACLWDQEENIWQPEDAWLLEYFIS